MKNNFAFSLSGRKVAPYILGIWLLVLLFGSGLGYFEYIFSIASSAPTVLDWSWFWNGVGVASTSFVFVVGYLLLGFFVMKYSIEAMSIRDEAFETDFDFRRYFWLVIKGTLLSVITFGIYMPWFITELIRFYAGGVSHRFNFIGFVGRPMTLFGLTILLAVLPSVLINGLAITYLFAVLQSSPASAGSLTVLWIVLLLVLYFLVIFIFQTLYYRWLIDFTYGQKRIALRVSWWKGAWFLMGQTFLTVITFGLYAPMFWLRTLRYFTSRMVLGDVQIEENFGMVLRPWRDWGYLWCQILLVIITLGIYLPWAYVRISTRFVPRCYTEDIDSPSEPMPEA